MNRRRERLNLESGLVPMFPLTECVLMPWVILPLHLFEPRYRALMDDLCESEPSAHVMAMTLLTENASGLYNTKMAPIHPVVCVGRVVEYDRLSNGRYNVVELGFGRATTMK